MPQTAAKCKAAGASKVETHAADLTDLEGRERLISELLAKHTTVDVLVNNAGMGVKGTPLEGVMVGNAAWRAGSGCCVAARPCSWVLQILPNCRGLCHPAGDPKEWEKMLHLNLHAPMHLIRSAPSNSKMHLCCEAT
jgi:NAD(P)-dependent dehydrogenase (short-subunit alcohol dehydrogenase family)